MIVFFDTSALVKLYVHEAHSDWTRRQVDAAGRCLVSQITWAETCAALALKQRTQQISADDAAFALKRLQAEWPGFARLAVDWPLILDAGELAQHFGLRAYDSVQLASAHRALASAGPTLALCCFDKTLNKAAAALGIHALVPAMEN